ncbi:8-amino-7-oxononanoate synthase [hydrothermal vent metagenome]|uniref:8-amino-7-oxononanoate synthase n=1 Tax=hydrothermal vent metagenome TaxID=652676 RepID=A0A3B1DXW0_9ZZZZ
MHNWLNDEINKLQQAGLYRSRRSVVPLPGGWCEVDGKCLLNFSANDYLGLSNAPRLLQAAKSALDKYGVGAGASALVSGRTPEHHQLEKRLATFEETEAALLFPTGYAANIGIITALVNDDSETVIFCDRLNHASLIDGCRLSKAKFKVYRHDDLSKLERALKKVPAKTKKLIVTDTIFSMDGDAPPLVELHNFASRYNATLLLDEAHATGLFGKQGRGMAELAGIESPHVIRIGTLSKAIGCMGGFVVGSQLLIDWLWNRSRSQIFSTALPPSICAAACSAIDMIEKEPSRRTNVLSLAKYLRAQLIDAKWQTIPSGIAPIIPIILDDPQRAINLSHQLQEEGFFIPAIRPPTVPQGTSRLRISLSAMHTKEDVTRLINVLQEIS